MYSDSSAAAEETSRDRNSERDLRNFLKAGSLDVNGYTGVSSYIKSMS